MQRGEKGFTIMELLIVIAIMGIIAAVVIPSVSAFRTSGQLVAANGELENVKTAALVYHANNNAWPSSSSQLTAFLAGNLTGTYGFDTNCGWVINGTGWQPELKWQAGTTGVKGTHGKWVKP
jgi:prepilin-type N-terminal cleavage/methylation domain-containing protein